MHTALLQDQSSWFAPRYVIWSHANAEDLYAIHPGNEKFKIFGAEN